MAALGFHVNAHRIAAYAFAGLLAALGGILQVWNYKQISPGSVSVDGAINVLIIAVVGGITRPIGPFIGALIFVLLRTFALDFLREIGLDGNRFRSADRPRLPRHRVLVAGRRDWPVGALAPARRAAAARPGGGGHG